MPATAALVVGKGERLDWNFAVDGAPNVTGWTFAAYLKDTVQPPRGLSPVLTLGVGTGLTVVTAATGQLRLSLTSAQTKDTLVTGTFTFDVWRTDAGSEIVVASGTVTVTPVARW